MQKKTHIVIVGGGAGGLELATRLGNELGKKAKISLVDTNLTHVWKPLWHEVAAGTLYANEDEVNYIAHAYKHHFNFHLGKFIGLNRNAKTIHLSEVYDKQATQVLPERDLSYDILVFAIGSLSNDFNIPGVKKYCHFLDSPEDCLSFHRDMLNHLLRLQENLQSELNIAIVGGGATGVELAAELQSSIQQALRYGKSVNGIENPAIQITIIESASRLLSGLPEEISRNVHQELEKKGIKVLVSEKVKSVDDQYVYTEKQSIKAGLKLWAAGIKISEVFKEAGLKINNLGQLLVKQNLQSVEDDGIFALGDCASCPQEGGKTVPPRAQAAHQEAKLLAQSLKRYLDGQSLLNYVYRDRGSLISLSQTNSIGQWMGSPLGRVNLEGKIAQLAYRFLYRQHQAALNGWLKVALLSIAQYLTKPLRPRLKLH
ncbi:MAG TPA: NAD(P)/FAD-dependent oxidoreductase [Coxiellaceae bacterium]|nr:NAD(P)/FAD-dependent oxidoreductase [Coxiellaceae bacterium]